MCGLSITHIKNLSITLSVDIVTQTDKAVQHYLHKEISFLTV